MDEQHESPEISLPEDEQDLIDQLEGEGRELSEQEKNLAIAQAKLIGDL
jgi:hypothetical protein